MKASKHWAGLHLYSAFNNENTLEMKNFIPTCSQSSIMQCTIGNSCTHYSLDSACLVSDLRDDKHGGVDGGISTKLEALEPDLFEQNVQVRT